MIIFVAHEQRLTKTNARSSPSCGADSNDGQVKNGTRTEGKDCSRVVIGWEKPTDEERQAQRDAEMRTQFFGSVELFPKRIDQLLEALNRVGIVVALTSAIATA